MSFVPFMPMLRTRVSRLFGAGAGSVAVLAVATASLPLLPAVAQKSPDVVSHVANVPAQPDWASSGQNNHNTRYAVLERTIDARNVGNLKPKWIFTTAGNVSATATVVGGVAYVPDWGGKLWAIDINTGEAVWSHDISDYTGI